MKKTLILCCMLAFSHIALAEKKPEVFFIEPKNGAVVESPVTVKFGLRNFGVAPAGVRFDNTGHHHLIINAELPPLDKSIPADDQHIHFGGGQTQADIELEPGEHTLQLLLGDFLHIPHDEPIYSEKITITVK